MKGGIKSVFFKKLLLGLFSFFIVLSISAEAETKVFQIDHIWTITFNKALSENSLTKNNIYIYDKAYKKIDCEIIYTPGDKFFKLKPKSFLLPNSNYSIYVSKNVTSVYNQLLSKDFIFDFKTAPLTEDNISTYKEKLINSCVDISYSSVNGKKTSKGILVRNDSSRENILLWSIPEDLFGDKVSFKYLNEDISASILWYNREKNIIGFKVDSNIGMSLPKHKNPSRFEHAIEISSLSFKLLLDSSGNIVALYSISSNSMTYLSDLVSMDRLNQDISSLNMVINNTIPPTVDSFTFDQISSSLNFQLSDFNEYVLFLSSDNKNFNALFHKDGKIRQFKDKTLSLSLDELDFFKDNIPTKIYVKVYSVNNGILSFKASSSSTNIVLMSEEDKLKSIVQNGYFYASDTKTISSAFDNYFTDGNWTYNADSEYQVCFSGQGYYKGGYQRMDFFFSVDLSNSLFRLEKILINNYPMNFSDFPNLHKQIYLSSK